MDPSQNRGEAAYLLSWAQCRPVTDCATTDLGVTLDYDEYREARNRITALQQAGAKPMPLFRLRKDDDQPILELHGLDELQVELRNCKTHSPEELAARRATLNKPPKKPKAERKAERAAERAAQKAATVEPGLMGDRDVVKPGFDSELFKKLAK